jgi:formylglycine-generating enzyme required for sulfatase activity
VLYDCLGFTRDARMTVRVAIGLILLMLVPTGALAEEDRKRAEPASPPLGKTFRDCPTCPEMVVIPAGAFMMGSNDYDDEKPVHKVAIANPFAVGKFEVTFAEWDACVSEDGCRHKPDDRGWGRDHPVIDVSWNDVTEQYLPWLSRKTGHTYRLLGESEWEYAARAGSTTAYSWGEEIGKNNANCSPCGSGMATQTAPVGSFQPNAFGLYDMHGNVWEWVEDCWHDTYVGAPSNGRAWTMACSGEMRRVVRGGSWNNFPWHLRSANRHSYYPNYRTVTYGFRVATTL